MNNKTVIVAIIIAISLVVSVAILSSAIKSFGHSLERTASNQLGKRESDTVKSRLSVFDAYMAAKKENDSAIMLPSGSNTHFVGDHSSLVSQIVGNDNANDD